MNAYGYVSNDPLNATDPNGLLSLLGVVRFTGGSLEAAVGVGFGVATSWTGLGAVTGGAITLHGLDVMQSAVLGTDTFTSQALQATGLSQDTANAIDVGISGASALAAGLPILPYSLFGPALSGGGVGTSLLSATARGFVGPFGPIEGILEQGGPIWNALSAYYGTNTEAAILGRAASDLSAALGSTLEGYTASSLYVSPAFGANWDNANQLYQSGSAYATSQGTTIQGTTK